MACRVAERLSRSKLSEQCSYRKFVIRIFQYGNSTVNSLRYKIHVKMFWPENNTQIKHIHFLDWFLDYQATGSSIYSGKVGFTSAQTGANSKKCIHQCPSAPEMCSAPSKWVGRQLWVSKLSDGTVPLLDASSSWRLCSCFNQPIYSHDTHMLSTSFACRKHPFPDDWLHHALLWYPVQLQSKSSFVIYKWSRSLLPQSELTLASFC